MYGPVTPRKDSLSSCEQKVRHPSDDDEYSAFQNTSLAASKLPSPSLARVDNGLLEEFSSSTFPSCSATVPTPAILFDRIAPENASSDPSTPLFSEKPIALNGGAASSLMSHSSHELDIFPRFESADRGNSVDMDLERMGSAGVGFDSEIDIFPRSVNALRSRNAGASNDLLEITHEAVISVDQLEGKSLNRNKPTAVMVQADLVIARGGAAANISDFASITGGEEAEDELRTLNEVRNKLRRMSRSNSVSFRYAGGLLKHPLYKLTGQLSKIQPEKTVAPIAASIAQENPNGGGSKFLARSFSAISQSAKTWGKSFKSTGSGQKPLSAANSIRAQRLPSKSTGSSTRGQLSTTNSIRTQRSPSEVPRNSAQMNKLDRQRSSSVSHIAPVPGEARSRMFLQNQNASSVPHFNTSDIIPVTQPRPMSPLANQHPSILFSRPSLHAPSLEKNSSLKKTSDPYLFDELDEEDPSFRANWSVEFYLRTGWLFGLCLVDFIAGLILQVFWFPGDFVCRKDTPEKKGGTRAANIAVLSIIILLHIGHLLRRMQDVDLNGRSVQLRIFYSTQIQSFLSAIFQATFLLCIIASLIILIVHSSLCMRLKFEDSRYTITRRIHLLVHIIRVLYIMAICWRLKKNLRTRLQTVVSVNKRRFKDPESNCDLDLTYICDRLIAMALPCVDHALYRNDIRDVAKFFSSRHYGHFVVTNLCERFEEGGNGNYDPNLLYGQVQKLPMYDHNAPAIQTLVAFCRAATEWLDTHPMNVLAVHCQGGKGRTGTFCAALLLWVGVCSSASEALDYFAKRRTQPLEVGWNPLELQGVAAPSQLRYMEYMEQIIYKGVDIGAYRPLLLTGITINTMPLYLKEEVKLALVIHLGSHGGVFYDHYKAFGPITCAWADNKESWDIKTPPLLLQGDVSVRFFRVPDGDPPPIGDTGVLTEGAHAIRYGQVKCKQVMFFTFNTAFHEGDLTLCKKQIDEAYKDRNHVRFHEEFTVSLSLSPPPFDDVAQALAVAIPAPTPRENDEFMAKRRTIEKSKRLENLFMQVGEGPLEFRQGELIMQPNQEESERGVLYFIVQGDVAYEPAIGGEQSKGKGATIAEQYKGHGALGLTHEPNLDITGAGHIVGVYEFLYGKEGSSHVYRAVSQIVTIRRIRLGAGPNELALPSPVPSISPEDECLAWESVARAVGSWSSGLARQIQHVTELAHFKYDRGSSDGTGLTERARLVNKVMISCEVPLSETLINMQKVTLIGPKKEDGHLFLFDSWMIFWPLASSGCREVIIPLKSVKVASPSRETLVVTRELDEQPPPSPRVSATVAAASSSPNVPSTSFQERVFTHESSGSGKNVNRSGSIKGNLTKGMLRWRSLSMFEKAKNNLGKLSTLSKSDSHRQGLNSRTNSVSERNFDSARSGDSRPKSTSFLEGAQPDSTDSRDHSRPTSWDSRTRSEDAADMYSSSPCQGPASGPASGPISRSKRPRRASVFDLFSEKNHGEEFNFGFKDKANCELYHAGVRRQLELVGRLGQASKWVNSEDMEVLKHYKYLMEGDSELNLDEIACLSSLFEQSQTLSFKKGETLVQDGALRRVIFHILAGSVSARSATNAVLAVWQGGEVVGERSFLSQGNRGHHAVLVAESEVRVQPIDFEMIEGIAERKPTVAARFYRSLALSLGTGLQRQLWQLRQIGESVAEEED